MSSRRRLTAADAAEYEVEFLFSEDEVDASALDDAVSSLVASGVEGVTSKAEVDPVAELEKVPGVDVAALSPPSPPPYQLPVVNVNLKTARRDAIKSDSAEYDAESHEFHRVCMHDTNNTPTDPAFADWTTDGNPTTKLNEIKAAELLNPIGKFREGCKFTGGGSCAGVKTLFCFLFFFTRWKKRVWTQKEGKNED